MHHVLVVDDRPDICTVVQMALEADGTCRVSSAFTAEQAIAAIAEDRPDAAIIDAILPRGSGLKLASQAVDLGIPVLIITGEPEIQRRLSEIGCPYLAKPFHVHQIITETRALLDDTSLRMRQLAASLARLIKTSQRSLC